MSQQEKDIPHQPLDTLQDVLRIPSYSGQEEEKQQYITDFFAQRQIESFQQDGVVIVHLPGADQTKAFLFNSHVDVVDILDRNRWKHDPWGAEIVDGRIYGRGASDMQMGLAASLETAAILGQKIADGEELPCDIWFTYAPKEEVDGSGTQNFAKWFVEQGYMEQYQEVAVVFTEPTDMTTAEYGHRGNFFIKATIDGDAGHASRPQNVKTHAILAMTDLIQSVKQESSLWQEKFQNGEFAPPTITPTSFTAKSESANAIAAHAEAVFDLRTIPGFHQEAYDRINELAQERGIDLSLLYPDAPTGYTSPDAKIIRTLQGIVQGLQLEISKGSADLGFMTEVGAEGVIFGPGERSQAHVIDESAPINHLEQAIDIYQRLFYAWATDSSEKSS